MTSIPKRQTDGTLRSDMWRACHILLKDVLTIINSIRFDSDDDIYTTACPLRTSPTPTPWKNR